MKVHRLATVTVAIVAVFIFFQIANSTFLGVENLWNMSVQIVPVGLLALGLVFVLLVGEIDLSSAALSGVAATIAARMAINGGESLVVAVIVAIVVSVAFTSLEAFIIVAGVPSLIVTLGGMIALGGALLVALPSTFEVNTAGTTFGNVGNFAFAPYAGWIIGALVALCSIALLIRADRMGDPGRPPARRFVWLAVKSVVALALIAVVVEELNRGGGFPLPLLILLVLLVVANWFLRSTSYGVHLYAVGVIAMPRGGRAFGFDRSSSCPLRCLASARRCPVLSARRTSVACRQRRVPVRSCSTPSPRSSSVE
jgi:D-xylose transport system permease protein